MELIIAKYGNLMGSPDLKQMMHELGPASRAADKLWDDLAAIKYKLGLNGQSTSAALLEPDCPALFPALVDFSWICADPASSGEQSLRYALDGVTNARLRFDEVRSVLITHPHPDHHDPRILEHLPNARVLAHPYSGIPGAAPLDPAAMPPSFMAIDTPGHGTPHCSYIADLRRYDLSVCIAGDLIMSHAHFLSLDKPLSFTDAEAGRRSVRDVMDALASRPTKYKLILPGHDIPFFVSV